MDGKLFESMKDVNSAYLKEETNESLMGDAIGPGVDVWLKATEDGMGYQIELKGTFRSGGMTEDEVVTKLRDFWKTIDIDAMDESKEEEKVEEADVPASQPSDPDAVTDEKPNIEPEVEEKPAEEAPKEEVPTEEKPAEEEKKEDVPPSEVE